MSDRTVLAFLPRSPEREGAPLRKWVVAGVVGLLAAAGAAVWFREFYLPKHLERSAARLTDEGVAAWRSGDLRRAELSFESARAMQPDSSRAAVLLGRMLIAQGDRGRGEAIFQALLASSPGAERERILVSYHDALVAAGAWDQRARLAVRELARAPENPVLIVGVVESARLARWDAAECDRQVAGHSPELLWVRLLRAQCLLNGSDVASARRELAAIGAVTPVISLLKARLWLRAGDPEAARLSLARVTSELDDLHIALGLVALAGDEPHQARQAVRELCRRTDLAAKDSQVLEAMLAALFVFPDRTIAEELTARLAREARAVEPTAIGALWLYSSLSGADRAAAVWSEQLGSRFASWPINLTGRQLDQQVTLFAVNSLPLTRLLIDGLVAATPDPQPAKS